MESIYESVVTTGRRGVASLKESIDVVKHRIKEKERMNKFAERFGKQSGMTKREFR